MTFHNSHRALELQSLTGIQPTQVADLVRVAQLTADPAAGYAGRVAHVDWHALGISRNVLANLRALGRRYQYSHPELPLDVVWEELFPETRSWFIENRAVLHQIEEAFPAADED